MSYQKSDISQATKLWASISAKTMQPLLTCNQRGLYLWVVPIDPTAEYLVLVLNLGVVLGGRTTDLVRRLTAEKDLLLLVGIFS